MYWRSPKSIYPRIRSLTLVVLLLIGICVTKMIYITMVSPIIGYANNYDFIRIESCIGLWDYTGAADKSDSHPAGPVNRLIFDGDIEMENCVLSIDLLFPWLTTLFHQNGDTVDFREVAGFRILAVLTLLVLLLFVSDTPEQRISVAASFALMFGDITYLSYFNTLYSEFSVLLGLAVCVSIAALLWSTTRLPSILTFTIGLIGIALLGLAKEQYAPLAAAFGVLFAAIFACRWRMFVRSFVLVIASICALFSFTVFNQKENVFRGSMIMANKTDTFLGVVLPNATDYSKALSVLGLPESCAEGIGKDWYTPGLMEQHPCPQLHETSRLLLVPLFFQQPSTFFLPLLDAVDHVRPTMFAWRLGIFENPSTGRSWSFNITRATSLSTLLDAMPDWGFRLLIYSLIILGLTAVLVVALTCRLDAQRWSGCIFMFGIAGMVILYAITSSVFGDGLVELDKHATVVCFCVGLQVIAVLILACLSARRLRYISPLKSSAIPKKESSESTRLASPLKWSRKERGSLP